MKEEEKSIEKSLSLLFSNQSQTITDIDSHLAGIISQYPSKIYSDFHHSIAFHYLFSSYSSLLFES